MANIYVRSTDGNNADTGATWALAEATLAGADATPDAAGDTIWVSQVHAESTAGAVTLAYAGTPATPSRILCGDDAAEPPTALATTATVTTTSGAISLGGSFYCYGITFNSSGTTTFCGANANQVQLYEQCKFRTSNTGGGGSFLFGSQNNVSQLMRFVECQFKPNATGQVWSIYGRAEIRGGSIESGATTPTTLFALSADRTNGILDVSGFDFSNLSSSLNLCKGDTAASGHMVFRNCKLPASWSGSLVSGTIPGPGPRYEMHNCDSTDTNYRMWVEDYAGSIKHETTIVRTGGASDGTTALSWKMVTSANAEYPTVPLVSPEGSLWDDTSGSSKTLTVEIVHDSQGAGSGSKFQDDEVWLEVMYLGTSGVPLGAWITDCKADVLATAANQADSSETWTTTGLTTPVKQALSVTFTPQEKGVITWRVVCAKASKTLYVCPKAALA